MKKIKICRGEEKNVRSFPRIADPDIGDRLGGKVAVAINHVLWQVTFFGFVFVLFDGLLVDVVQAV